MRLDEESLASAASRAGLTPASLVIQPLDLPSSAITLDPAAPLYPASMIKVPLAAAALAAIAEGQLDSLESQIEIVGANMTANDAASPLLPGYRATLHELMLLAISRSDNVATNTLFDLVGRERATTIVRERFHLLATEFHRKLSGSDPLVDDPGWDGVHRNAHPASDAAHLFRQIAGDAVPNAALLREMLAMQAWNEKLSRGLRAGDRFLHKTGDSSEVTHDGGILITAENKRYVLVAYTGLPSNDDSNARLSAFMSDLRGLL
jgi:beta-lactamase class A